MIRCGGLDHCNKLLFWDGKHAWVLSIIILITVLRRCYRKLRLEEGNQQKGWFNNPGKEQQSGKRRPYTAWIFKIIGKELKQCFVSGFKGWRKILIMMLGS